MQREEEESIRVTVRDEKVWIGGQEVPVRRSATTPRPYILSVDGRRVCVLPLGVNEALLLRFRAVPSAVLVPLALCLLANGFL